MMGDVFNRANRMTAPAKKKVGKKKPPTALETSESIAAQTAAFLDAGGQVEQVKRGISGQEPMAGRKHITYAKKA